MGFWEIALIFVILLIVVGPDRLPGVARTLGYWVGRARRFVASVRAEVEQEFKIDEIRRSVEEQTRRGEFQEISKEINSISGDLRDFDRQTRQAMREDTQPESTLSAPPQTDPPPLAASAPASIKEQTAAIKEPVKEREPSSTDSTTPSSSQP